MADLPHVGPVDVTTNGVLAVFVQQPVQNTPAIQQGGVIYTEKWKGPYSKGKDITATLGENATLPAFWTWLGTTRVSRFTAPACPSTTVNGIKYTGVWKANQITVNQLTAGDHCEIIATFQASYDIGSGDITQPKQNDDLESWSVEWLSYSVSPMAFLANEHHEPHEIDVDQALGRTGITGLDSELGNASYVIQWQQHNGSSVYYNGSGQSKNGVLNYWWREDPTRLPGQTQMYCLNTAEAAVMDKTRLQRSAVYHYPVITHTTVFEGYDNAKYTAEIGDKLDVVQDLPTECPYSFKTPEGAEKWKWIKIDDSITAQNDYVYKTNASTSTDKKVVATAGRRVKRKWTRKEKWAGYSEVDVNFYGTQPFNHSADGIKTSRWQIGKL